MNCYGALDLLQNLNINTLKFNHHYNTLNHDKLILCDNDEKFYYCKDREEFEKLSRDYPWEVVGIYYFYDRDTDAIVFEYRVDDTDVDEWETQDRLLALVPKSFFELYHIKLDFNSKEEE